MNLRRLISSITALLLKNFLSNVRSPNHESCSSFVLFRLGKHVSKTHYIRNPLGCSRNRGVKTYSARPRANTIVVVLALFFNRIYVFRWFRRYIFEWKRTVSTFQSRSPDSSRWNEPNRHIHMYRRDLRYFLPRSIIRNVGTWRCFFPKIEQAL